MWILVDTQCWLWMQAEPERQVAELPWYHRDPFDRLLVAQAQVEALPILTADRPLEPYDVELIRAG